MVETATRLPVKVEKKVAPVAAGMASFAPFDTLRREVDRLFDSFGGASWPFALARPSFPLGPTWPREMDWAVTPAVDVSEKEKEFEVSAELPGLTEKDIEVKLTNGNLVIKGEKKEEKEEREKDYFVSERRFGSFMRSFAIPPGVDAGKIEASFAKGVLTVKLPKTAEAQKPETKITVKAA